MTDRARGGTAADFQGVTDDVRTEAAGREKSDRAAADIAHLQEHGYVVARDLLSADQVQKICAELEPHFGENAWGRNDFEGTRTERVYSILAKCPSAADVVEHPHVMEVLDAFLRPSRLLAACQGTRIHPGETAQLLHCDDELGAPPRPRAPQCVSLMWALSPYTPENGSTHFVPGSHRWEASRQPDPKEATCVAMDPGSVLIWLGGVYHGGGPNTSAETRTGLSIIYFQPWLRQVENMLLAVPPEIAAGYSERVQRLLGYGVIDGLFFGHVDGRDPIKILRERGTPEGS